MVDFNKLREANKLRSEALIKTATKMLPATNSSAPSIPSSSSNSSERDREEDKAMLGDLLGSGRGLLNAWELQFCESVLNFLLKYPKYDISKKQADVLDKTWAKHVGTMYPDKTDPTPVGNPPAKFLVKQAANNMRLKKEFDDYDDDIPF